MNKERELQLGDTITDLKIVNNPMRFETNIYIIKRTVGGSSEIFYPEKNEWKKLEAGEDAKPSIALDDYLFKMLVDAIHKDYEPSNGNYTQGKLEAIELHLEDMRKLVFKQDKLDNKN